MARANKTLNILADVDAPEASVATPVGHDGPVASKDALGTAPAPPSSQSATEAVKALQRAIADAIERAIARLPEELRGNAFVIEAILNQELDKVNFGLWRSQIVVEVIALLQSGKSDVKHDPTELA